MESLDVSSLFVTKAQAMDFIARLNVVIQRVYTTNFHLEQMLSEQLGLQKKEFLLKLFRENNVSETTPSDIQAFLKKIQGIITTLPVVTLTIPFEPRDETLKSFSDWFLFTLKKQVLFAIEVDYSLLAGAKVTYNGKFKDYSMREKFKTLMDSILVPQNPQTTSSTSSQNAMNSPQETQSAPAVAANTQ